MIAQIRRHLQEAGESYFAHLRFAATVGLIVAGAGMACLLHAFVPALCQRSCSRTVRLLSELFADRALLPQVGRQSSGVITFVALSALAAVAAALPLLLGAPRAASVLLGVLSLGFPIAYLLTNPDLEEDQASSPIYPYG